MIEIGRDGSFFVIIDRRTHVQVRLSRDEMKLVAAHLMIELNVRDFVVSEDGITKKQGTEVSRLFRELLERKWKK